MKGCPHHLLCVLFPVDVVVAGCVVAVCVVAGCVIAACVVAAGMVATGVGVTRVVASVATTKPHP